MCVTQQGQQQEQEQQEEQQQGQQEHRVVKVVVQRQLQQQCVQHHVPVHPLQRVPQRQHVQQLPVVGVCKVHSVHERSVRAVRVQFLAGPVPGPVPDHFSHKVVDREDEVQLCKNRESEVQVRFLLCGKRGKLITVRELWVSI